jgi:glycosyltransferase involved in cell wall biosynthesis
LFFHRSGIPKARIAGAETATGDVLFFVDAHCEFNVKWLEPLLEQIVESRTTVVVPIIDVVDAETLQYKTNDLRFEVCDLETLHFTLTDYSIVQLAGRRIQMEWTL